MSTKTGWDSVTVRLGADWEFCGGGDRRAALASQINDESDEIAAEIAELTAAAEEGAVA